MVSEMDWIIHVLLLSAGGSRQSWFDEARNAMEWGRPGRAVSVGTSRHDEGLFRTTFRWVSRIVSGNWQLSGGDNLEPLTADRHRRSAE